MLTPMGDAAAKSAKADKATERAEKSGDKDDHAKAADAHGKAASALFAGGDADEAARHSKLAKKHRAKSGDAGAPKANPLMAWAKGKK
jgi:hypothetical protein